MGIVLTREELIDQAARDRAAGRTLAFANGCFDLLHVGHVRYLAAASREADRLVVAINDDDSVSRLKGSGRPIFPAGDRAELVAAVRGVDYVTIFSEPTVAPLLAVLKPDVHCKGTDYTIDTVPEREMVLSYGGRIAIVGDPKDHSTHDLLARIRDRSPDLPAPSKRARGTERGGGVPASDEPGGVQGSPPSKMTILVVRLGALGDVVHAIPAAAALRRAHPFATIHWLVEARHRAIVDLVTSIDRTIVLERATLGGWLTAIRDLRRTTYDLAIDLQGLLKSAVFARASGASRVIGFSIWHLREKTARPLYSTGASAEAAHVVRKNLQLLRAVGIDDDDVAFPLRTIGSAALDRLRQAIGEQQAFALINPGAAWPNKRWTPQQFGELAAFINDQCGVLPVVLWGPGEERLARTVADASSRTAILAPPTGLLDLVALSRAASLLVSGDTGPLHVATAVGTPTVSIFGPTDPARNGPLSHDDIVVSHYDECGCHYDRRCHQRRWCLATVNVPEVAAAVQQRLAIQRAHG